MENKHADFSSVLYIIYSQIGSPQYCKGYLLKFIFPVFKTTLKSFCIPRTQQNFHTRTKWKRFNYYCYANKQF